MPAKVLVVDDEQQFIRIVQSNLERAGYMVVTASDGHEALEQVEAEQPDLIVLDAMMPRMDGFEMLYTLRKNQSTRDLPVIMLTPTSQDLAVFQVWQSGRDSYLIKPFNPADLVALVQHIHNSGDGQG